MYEYWQRVIIVEIGGRRFTNTDFDIHFEFSGVKAATASTGRVSIFNLSKSSYDSIHVGDTIAVTAGYESSGSGIIFIGGVNAKKTEKDGADTEYIFEVIDGFDTLYTTFPISQTFVVNTPVSAVFTYIMKCCGIVLGSIQESGVVLDAGYTITTSADVVVKDMLTLLNTGIAEGGNRWNFCMVGGMGYLFKDETTIVSVPKIGYATGLISIGKVEEKKKTGAVSSEPDDLAESIDMASEMETLVSEGLLEESDMHDIVGLVGADTATSTNTTKYSVDSLLIWSVRIGGGVEIDVEGYSGAYVITSYKHTASGYDFSSKFEVQVI